MTENFHTPDHPDLPVNVAKTLIRTQSRGDAVISDGNVDETKLFAVKLASDVDGACLIAVPNSLSKVQLSENQKTATLMLGQEPYLSLSCTIELLFKESSTHTEARFAARHGALSKNQTLVRLLPHEGILTIKNQTLRIAGEDLLRPANAELAQQERRAVDHMNEDHLDAIKLYAEVLLKEPAGPWHMASLDMEGLDLSAGDRFARLWFNPPLCKPDDIKKRLVDLAIRARE